jgi:hypothetical protein
MEARDRHRLFLAGRRAATASKCAAAMANRSPRAPSPHLPPLRLRPATSSARSAPTPTAASISENSTPSTTSKSPEPTSPMLSTNPPEIAGIPADIHLPALQRDPPAACSNPPPRRPLALSLLETRDDEAVRDHFDKLAIEDNNSSSATSHPATINSNRAT